MGQPPRRASPHARQGTGAHARTRVEPDHGGIFLICPRAVRPCNLACAEMGGATSAARTVKSGATWGFRIDARGAGLQKQGEAETRVPKPPTPLGFSLPSSPVSVP
jgi:hypothetical protein